MGMHKYSFEKILKMDTKTHFFPILVKGNGESHETIRINISACG